MDIKLILMVISLLFLIGCKGGTQGPITTVDIYKGVDGLKMNFLKNAPSDEVFENSVMPVYIELRNEGAYNIVMGYLTVSLEEDYMEITNWPIKKPITGIVSDNQLVFDLKGKSKVSIEGEQGIVSLTANTKAIDELSEKHTSTILASACYEYETKLSQTVCIDTDVYNLRETEKACEVKDISLTSQGAPVAITKIETEMLPHQDVAKIRPHFVIYVRNKGNGEVIDRGYVAEACSSAKISKDKYNVVAITAFLSNKQLDCDVTESDMIGYLKLKDKEDTIRCVLEEGIEEREGTYSTPLNIELDYGYTVSIAKDIEIKKIRKY
ncbi:hypothetical protein J4209_05455 [Candidatus Woesearchaeota archaeon]|nr:hypothetical protein [Candidatus Woesearchaeota archaeon]